MDIHIKIWISFAISLLIVSAGAFIGHYAINQLADRIFWVEHTYKVETLVESVISQLKDAETGQRGYLLTNKLNYLEPYENSIPVLSSTLARVKRLTADNPKQQERINLLEVLANKKLTELRETIELNMDGNQAEALELVLTNHGKQLMDDIRIVIQEMHDEEKQLLLTRQQDFISSIRWAYILVSIGGILAFTIIGATAIVVGRDTKRYIMQRKQASRG